MEGHDWITPIKDQGSCGSCVAFGTLAALEALLRKNCYNDPDKELDLSEAHLLWCGGGSCDGWYMDEACDYLKTNGVPDEACFPYQPQNMSCEDTCKDWKNWIGDTKIDDWTNSLDVNSMKERLVNNGPQISGMAVYQDLFSYKSGVYRHVTGKLAGYHCISVIGYDDNEQCWICKNSWGSGWGEGGFFKIGYGECGIDDAFGMWDMKVQKAQEEGYVEHIAIDYNFTSSDRILYAFAGGKWRQKVATDVELSGIVKLMMISDKVYVKWNGEELTFIRCYK